VRFQNNNIKTIRERLWPEWPNQGEGGEGKKEDPPKGPIDLN
jgi:hypothetical protein